MFLDSALLYAFKSIEIKKKRNNKAGLMRSYSNVGRIYIKKNDLKTGLRYLENALDAAEAMQNTTQICDALLLIVFVQLKQKNIPALEKSFARIDFLMQQQRPIATQMNYHRMKSAYAKLKNDYKMAFVNYKKHKGPNG